MRGFSLDDRATAFAFRSVLFLAMMLMLVHSQRQERVFELAPFVLAGFHLLTSLFLWKASDSRLNSPLAQSTAFLWDISVAAGIMFFNEGFGDELHVMFFFAFFQVMAFFTAVMAARARGRYERIKKLEMRLALGKLANGGWGIKMDEDFDPEIAQSVHAVNAVMNNLARALKRVAAQNEYVTAQNEQLRDVAGQVLMHLAHEKERGTRISSA